MKTLHVHVRGQDEPHVLYAATLPSALDQARNITINGYRFREQEISPQSVIVVYVEGTYSVYGKAGQHSAS